MIYQLKLYYGAKLQGQAIYTAEIEMQDCKQVFLPENIEDLDIPLKAQIFALIEKDGFSAEDFEFGWLTQEEYDNRVDSYVAYRKSYTKEETK